MPVGSVAVMVMVPVDGTSPTLLTRTRYWCVLLGAVWLFAKERTFHAGAASAADANTAVAANKLTDTAIVINASRRMRLTGPFR
jgi:hypothetical protein